MGRIDGDGVCIIWTCVIALCQEFLWEEHAKEKLLKWQF